MRVLCIVSSPKPEERSYGRRMASTFLEEYRRVNPGHRVDILDLYEEDYSHLEYRVMESARREGLGAMVEAAEQFKEYDKYVVVSPMWNNSIPAVLKSYVDHIVVSGITFKYTRLGILKGLLRGRKAFYIGTRGRDYPFPASMGTRDISYIKGIFRFMGVKKFRSYILEGIEKNAGRVQKGFEGNLEEIRKRAREF